MGHVKEGGRERDWETVKSKSLRTAFLRKQFCIQGKAQGTLFSLNIFCVTCKTGYVISHSQLFWGQRNIKRKNSRMRHEMVALTFINSEQYDGALENCLKQANAWTIYTVNKYINKLCYYLFMKISEISLFGRIL